ncbi:MAG TPA: NADH-quinone oxidoreductase subunit C [Candidatus Binatia bacterium]|jgi:NADH-quinone oxidoreductase subunit C|nr:NADH-quinone oxidoreductase subunit C [Candidatus Binatia bacterium]
MNTSSNTAIPSSVTPPGPGTAPTDAGARITPDLPNPLAHLPIPFQPADYNLKGYHLDASVAPAQVVAAAQQLDQEGFSLDTITGVDWLATGDMEVVYDYFHPVKPLRVVVRSRISRANPEIPTISEIYPGANWHERETHDFFGIRFLGHPNLLPFLLPEDATYHPLRKDFTSCS